MPPFRWDPSYSVQVKHFDEQHQQLFRIINDLYDGMRVGSGQEVLRDVLIALQDYILLHFAGEEAVMRNTGYPKLQGHIAQHRKFTSKVEDVCTRYIEGRIGLSIDVLDFLTAWLQQHIVNTDKQYGEFLNSKGIA